MSEEKIPVIEVYGKDAVEEVLREIKILGRESNFKFDNKYVTIGIDFITIKCGEILKGQRKKIELKALVRESFGEAAIYKFNCCNG